ncbi:MAG: DEAD/DEAH box helicase family protein [Clostridiales bacterium]|nr:DEAD/DEAH box helicase family protein [Clostridiales bacterium]
MKWQDFILKVTDIIKYDDIEKWQLGDRILITAGTGTGKTYFVMNSLTKHANTFGAKILLLVNRVPLQNQIQYNCQELDENDVIDVKTYQSLENEILQDTHSFDEYKFIVCDEAHYFFSDAQFNNKTNLVLNLIKDGFKDKVVILMSATAILLTGYLKIDKRFVYTVKNNYNYIEGIYTYKNQDVIVQMLQSLPKDEKAIYFSKSVEKAFDMAQKLSDASFICSKGNSKHSQHINKGELNNIQQNECFECQVLCCTTALDNGINIIDEQVKHIIVDVFDIDTVIQCIGRKRVVYVRESVKLYFREVDIRYANTIYNSVTKDLEQASYLLHHGEKAFRKKYHKQDYSKFLIDIDEDAMRVNEAGAWKYQQIKSMCSAIKNKEKTWLQILFKQMGLDNPNVESLESITDSRSLTSYLQEVQDKPMFSEVQEVFRDTIKEMLNSLISQNRRRFGINSINEILKELGVPFVIESKRENKGEMRNQRYWIVKALS